ncbi:hypothetical protein NIES4103_64680 [Nostoc sp. NIES-4103]|nr:hypothetical protein NIES4103_64680 [Nostoc sp. NIES-4103]
MTPVASSRETLSAVPPGGNPQDRTASPRRWLPNALPPPCPMPHAPFPFGFASRSWGTRGPHDRREWGLGEDPQDRAGSPIPNSQKTTKNRGLSGSDSVKSKFKLQNWKLL